MNQSSSSHAIKLALAQKWDEAIKVNKALLKNSPTDLDCLKRTAYAYLQLGNIEKAKSYYQKALKLDKHDTIAIKNLKRLDSLTKKPEKNHVGSTTTSCVFVEEPGRTKIVSLINLASNTILCNIAFGQEVCLVARKRSIEVRNGNKTYLGALPDDISHRLDRLMSCGNQYEAFVKHVDKNKLSVFIRETKRGKEFENTPSFVNNIQASYIPYVRKNLANQEALNTSSLEALEEKAT